MNPTIRAHWAQRQGLDGSLAGASAHDVLVATGWMRSVGGAGPYLGLHARAGLSREAIDAAVLSGEICELPSARGCTYVVPRADYPVALAAGQGKADEAQIQTAKKFCGVTDAEIDALCTAILDQLGGSSLDPKDLKERLGGVVRHLGDVGKKKGLTTTLPLGLGRLQSHGEIRRIPTNGRLDHQRYLYARWTPNPLAGRTFTPDALGVELARRFFRWIGPATTDQLAWWAGMTKKAAKAAVAEVGVVSFEDGSPQWLFPDDRDRLRSLAVPDAPSVRFVGSLDNLAHLRREVGPLVDPADEGEGVAGGGFGPGAGRTPVERVSTVLDLPHHAIVDRGRLIGLWDYDPGARRVVHRLFGNPDVDAALADVSRFVTDDLGDARSFSLDSPESRGERLAALRTRGTPRRSG